MTKYDEELEKATESIQKAEGNWALIMAVKHIIKALQASRRSE